MCEESDEGLDSMEGERFTGGGMVTLASYLHKAAVQGGFAHNFLIKGPIRDQQR